MNNSAGKNMETGEPRAYSAGFWGVARRSLRRMVNRPIFWFAVLLVPLFGFFFFIDLMSEGLPAKVPAAIVDNDHSDMSRTITQNLAEMQMVDLKYADEDFSRARKDMQKGEIFGYFLIPDGFQEELLAGRSPVINFYINMAFYVPGSLLLKNFKTTAVYTKAGIAVSAATQTGLVDSSEAEKLMLPVNVELRPLNNPWLNYGVYLSDSFVPGLLQLMIMLVTCFTLGQEIKYRTSLQLMRLAKGSVVRAVAGELFPQTLIWIVIAVFMESWLFRWGGYPMNGSWLWLTLSEVMFVLASQGFALFIFGVLPNLRLSLSVSALLGILSFSIAAFSFPVESMYPAIGIFSWILPVRYNFLIYIDQALNGIDVYYSRFWYIGYICFMVAPLIFLWRIKKAFMKPVYAP